MQRYTSKGFTLLELSVSLVIISLLIVGGFSLSLAQLNRSKTDITNKNMQTISDALTTFLAINGRLPCPASSGQLRTNASFGKEQALNGSPLACNTTTSNIYIFSGNLSGDTQYYGVAPVRTLNLPDEVMFDGWGNRINYVVQQTFANSEIVNSNTCVDGANAADNHSDNSFFCFRGQASGSTSPTTNDIVVNNLSGNTVTKDAVFILLSHGENGYGAFLKNASIDVDNGNPSTTALQNPTPPTSNPAELMNLNCNSSGVCTNNGLNQTYVQNTPTSNFDDILFFKTRNNLLYECNKLGNNACSLSQDILIR